MTTPNITFVAHKLPDPLATQLTALHMYSHTRIHGGVCGS
jgi:hypothetical protein